MLNQHCTLCFLRSEVFCDVTLCRVNSSQCSEGLLCLHLQSYLSYWNLLHLCSPMMLHSLSIPQCPLLNITLQPSIHYQKHQTVLQTSQPVHSGPTTCTSSFYENVCNIKCILFFSITRSRL
jgi:hypothetical protein